MGTQQHHSLTCRPRLLPHLEEQLGAGPVSLAVVRDAQGLIWEPKCVPLFWLVCPCVQLLGVPHRFVCTGTTGDPSTPKPTQGLAPHGHAQVLPPSLVNTCSHQCWSWSPRHPAVPSRSVLGCGSGMGIREGLGASLSALSTGAGPLGTDTCHPPKSHPQGHPKVLQGLGLGWSSGKPPQPPGSPQLLFCSVVSVW